MTVKDYIFIVQAEFELSNVQITVDPPVILQAMNESLKLLLPVMQAADDSFWTASFAFGSAADIAFPANHIRTRLIEIPGAAYGAARRLSHREWQTVMNNTVETSSADLPLYRDDAATFHLDPPSAGTIYFLRTFPEVTLLTQDLTLLGTATQAVLPWAFEEAFLNGVLWILSEREAGNPDIADNQVKKLFDIAAEAKAAFDKASSPSAIFRENMATPKLPPPRQEQQQQ